MSGFRAAAQAPFTNQPVPGFLQMPLGSGTAAWGDYDNDGKLDLLITGSTNNAQNTNGVTQLWHNDGNGQFHLVALPVSQMTDGMVAWVDYDNDGYLDFMLTGIPADSQYTPLTLLYHNQHNGTFTNAPIPDLASGAGVFGGPITGTPALAWGDYDHDGRPDLAIIGLFGDVQVWHNDGGGAFSQVSLASSQIPSASTVQWADMDSDGWVDLVLGYPSVSGNNLPQIFHNNITNNAYPLFTQATTFPPIANFGKFSTVAVADYNNDGLLDLPTAAYETNDSLVALSLELNLGGNQYTNTGIIPGTRTSVGTAHHLLAAGDYDNDGVADFALLILNNQNNVFAGVCHNDGGGRFTTNALPGLVISGTHSLLAFADYDNDGRLDLFTASDGNPPQLWHNITPLTNTPPTAPTGLNAVPFTNGVQLSWNPAADAQTPSAGLSYNLRVGTVPGTDNYIAASADLATGWRRVVQRGAIQGTNYTLTQMPPGIYYWSVQAIDAAFAGGKFGTEGTFAIPGIAITPAYCANVTASSAVFYCSAYTGGTLTTGYFEWGLTTSYGNATAPQSLGAGIGTVPFHQLLSGLQPGTYYHFRVVASNAVTIVRGVDTSFYTDPAMLLGDVNGDGVISGSEAGNIISNYFFASQVVLTNPATLGGGNFQFGLAIPGWNFTVQASSDLLTWSNLTTSATPFYEFLDPQATNSPHRYYRLR